LELTLRETPPGGATQWTTRSMAARLGVGKDTVARIWADHNLKTLAGGHLQDQQ
jgi:hypothetical protein